MMQLRGDSIHQDKIERANKWGSILCLIFSIAGLGQSMVDLRSSNYEYDRDPMIVVSPFICFICSTIIDVVWMLCIFMLSQFFNEICGVVDEDINKHSASRGGMRIERIEFVRQQPISGEIAVKANQRFYDIFISLRFSEKGLKTGNPWKPVEAAELLKKKLLSKGYTVFLCALENGDSIYETVLNALTNSRFFVIMGSETYGAKTNSKISTYQESQFITDMGPHYYLIQMCDNFEEPHARLQFTHTETMYDRWRYDLHPDQQVPVAILDGICRNYERKKRAV